MSCGCEPVEDRERFGAFESRGGADVSASCYACLVTATVHRDDIESLVRELYGLGEVRRELGRHALAGLGSPGFVALAAICAHGPVRVSEAAHLLAVDTSVVSRQIAALDAAGYVMRMPDPLDRRAQQIAVTEAGREVLDVSHRRMVEAFAHALDAWSEQDVNALTDGLSRLRGAFSALTSVAIESDQRAA